VLDEQIAANEKSYVAPHPESAKVVPASEAVTERAKGRKQEVDGIRVREDGGADGDIEEMEKVLKKVVINGGGEGKH
jgi:CTP synthase